MTIILNPACDSCSCTGTEPVFICGQFTAVDGTSRLLLARLDANGDPTASWQVDVTASFANPIVNAMLLDGDTLYITGSFDTVGGTARASLAAIDAATGTVTSFSADLAGGSAEGFALAVTGSILYVGGGFSSIGGTSRNNAASVAADGTVQAWDPDTDSNVLALAVSGSNIYLGGQFSTVSGGTARNALAAFDTSGSLQAWDPGVTSRNVRTMVADSSIIYIGGSFSTCAGSARLAAAAVHTDGTLQSWDPSIRNATGVNAGNVRSLFISGTTVYIGGSFLYSGSTERSNACAVSTSGTLSSWDPNVTPTIVSGSGNGVYGLYTDGSVIYLAGIFTAVGASSRSDAAAVTTAGRVLTWDPNLTATSTTGARAIIAAE